MIRALKPLHKDATKWQLYGYLPSIALAIHVRWTGYFEHCWRSKDEFINDVFPRTPSHGHINIDLPLKSYIHPLCVDTVCRRVDLLKVMADRDEWWEKLKGFLVRLTWVIYERGNKWSYSSCFRVMLLGFVQKQSTKYRYSSDIAFSPTILQKWKWFIYTIVLTRLQLGRFPLLF